MRIGAIWGSQPPFHEVAAYLKRAMPARMTEWEFETRIRRLARSVPAKAEAQQQLLNDVAEVIAELEQRREIVDDRADRDLDLAAAAAQMERTAEGQRLANYLLASEKGCISALLRLKALRKSGASGPKPGSGPKQGTTPGPDAVAEAVVASAPAATGPPPVAAVPDAPGPAPAAVADDAPAAVVAQVYTGDPALAPLTTTEAGDRRERGVESGESVVLTVEAILTTSQAVPFSGVLTVEAISTPTPLEPGAALSTIEAISAPTPSVPGSALSTLEAISAPTPSVPGSASSTLEAIFDGAADKAVSPSRSRSTSHAPHPTIAPLAPPPAVPVSTSSTVEAIFDGEVDEAVSSSRPPPQTAAKAVG